MKGKNKALLEVDGIRIIDRILSEIDEIFDEIIIVTNSPEELNVSTEKYIIVRDMIENIGPLGGIYSALMTSTKEAVFILPCDLPYLKTNIIEEEIELFQNIDCDAIVPRLGTYLEPLHSIFKKCLNKELFEFIQTTDNYFITSFLDLINVYYFDIEQSMYHKKVFTNINTLRELNEVNKSRRK
ncbi:MAG: molybdenum cofactor guanylyltransferase [Bacteroidetes bacterium]|nr:molybdenum cofactor guanylyltransferase [Bacteroidota bacterium]